MPSARLRRTWRRDVFTEIAGSVRLTLLPGDHPTSEDPMTRPHRPASGPSARALRPSGAERARTVASRPAAAVCAAGIDGSRVLASAVTADREVLLVVAADGDVARAVRGCA